MDISICSVTKSVYRWFLDTSLEFHRGFDIRLVGEVPVALVTSPWFPMHPFLRSEVRLMFRIAPSIFYGPYDVFQLIIQSVFNMKSTLTETLLKDHNRYRDEKRQMMTKSKVIPV
jgi:hypothetical protein